MDGLQYASADLIVCGRPVNGWHVTCWSELREVKNAGEASLYLKLMRLTHFFLLQYSQFAPVITENVI